MRDYALDVPAIKLSLVEMAGETPQILARKAAQITEYKLCG